MHCNLQEGDHHGGYEPDVDHLGVWRCRQGLGFADEAEEGISEYGDHGCNWGNNSHGGQDKEHREVHFDHHVDVLRVPSVGKVTV